MCKNSQPLDIYGLSFMCVSTRIDVAAFQSSAARLNSYHCAALVVSPLCTATPSVFCTYTLLRVIPHVSPSTSCVFLLFSSSCPVSSCLVLSRLVPSRLPSVLYTASTMLMRFSKTSVGTLALPTRFFLLGVSKDARIRPGECPKQI